MKIIPISAIFSVDTTSASFEVSDMSVDMEVEVEPMALNLETEIESITSELEIEDMELKATFTTDEKQNRYPVYLGQGHLGDRLDNSMI